MSRRTLKRPPGGWTQRDGAPDAPPQQGTPVRGAPSPSSTAEAGPAVASEEYGSSRGDTRARFAVAALIFATVFMVLAARALQLGHTPDTPGFSQVRAQNTATPAETVSRGDLLDRNGEMLATSLETYSLYARREEVWDPEATAHALAGVLPDFNEDVWAERLSGESGFVWVQRGLTPRRRQAVFDLALPGLHFQAEPRRVYPRGRLAAHVLGFTDIDTAGVEGAEFAFEDTLTAGGDVRLSLDLRVQFALDEALRDAVERYRADGAVGLVTNVRTGEILAMTSLPDFDPNRPAEAPASDRFHRAVTGVYELGSVFKVFTFAAALDRGAVQWNETLPTTRPVIAGTVEVSDPASAPTDLTVREAFMRSSNVAAAHLGVNTPPNVFSRYLENFGLLTPAPSDVGAPGRPLLPANWGEPARATIAYGHGLAVSPVAFAAAFGAAVNGGAYLAPRLTPVTPGQLAPRRVLEPRTSAVIATLLRETVLEGTGRRADSPGFEVGGKTGTAEQPGPGGYDPESVIATFAAVFPANAPRYAVIIMLDRPKSSDGAPQALSASVAAAPVVGRLITRIGPLLGVPAQRDPAAAAAAYRARVSGETLQ